jgi:hypothetical protein
MGETVGIGVFGVGFHFSLTSLSIGFMAISRVRSHHIYQPSGRRIVIELREPKRERMVGKGPGSRGLSRDAWVSRDMNPH